MSNKLFYPPHCTCNFNKNGVIACECKCLDVVITVAATGTATFQTTYTVLAAITPGVETLYFYQGPLTCHARQDQVEGS